MKLGQIGITALALTVVASAFCAGDPIRRPQPPRQSPPPMRWRVQSSQPSYIGPSTNYNQVGPQNYPWQYGTTYITPGFMPSFDPSSVTPGVPAPYNSPGIPYSFANLPPPGTANLQSTFSYTSRGQDGGKVLHITNRRSIASPDQTLVGRGYIAIPEHQHATAPN